MAILGSFSKFLGGVTNGIVGPRSVTYFRDGRNAVYDLGQKGEFYLDNTPRQKFNYFIDIEFNGDALAYDGKPIVDKFLNNAERRLLVPLAKSVDLPGAKITTDRLNQYNHWKISQTKIDYDPITLTFHDVVDGKTLRFWEMYYEYYFKDGLDLDSANFDSYPRKRVGIQGVDNSVSTAGVGVDDMLTPEFDKDFGYNVETIKNQRNLIKTISIYLVHAQKYSKVDLINPRVAEFTHDSLTYSDSQLIELSLTFEYEYFLYDNHFTELPESVIQSIYGNSNALEMTKFTPARPEYTIRNRTEYQQPLGGSAEEVVKDTSVFGNIQRSIGGVISDLPNAVGRAASTGIMTGEFDFPLDPNAVKDQVIGNAKGSTKAVGARNFGSLAKDITGTFIPGS